MSRWQVLVQMGAYTTKQEGEYPSADKDTLRLAAYNDLEHGRAVLTISFLLCRGIPDVSANGAKLRAYVSGVDTSVWGASISAPIWASILSLINQKRSALGKGPVGFVQPVLYEHPEVFHDITKGINPGCGTDGFSAVPGWDPVRTLTVYIRTCTQLTLMR